MQKLKLCFIFLFTIYSIVLSESEFDYIFEQITSFDLKIPDSIIPMGSIKDIAVSKNGELFLIESSGGRLFKFSEGGDYIKSWGGKSEQGKSHISVPGTIYLDDFRNELIVTDWLRSRVIFFTLDGEYKDSFLASSEVIGVDGAIPVFYKKDLYLLGGVVARNHQMFREKDYYAKGLHLFKRDGKHIKTFFDVYEDEILERNIFNDLRVFFNVYDGKIIAGYLTSYKLTLMDEFGKVISHLNTKPENWNQLEIKWEDAFEDNQYSFSDIRRIEIYKDYIILLYTYYSQSEKKRLSPPQLLIYDSIGNVIKNGVEVSWLYEKDNCNTDIFKKGGNNLFYAIRLKDGKNENSGYEVAVFECKL